MRAKLSILLRWGGRWGARAPHHGRRERERAERGRSHACPVGHRGCLVCLRQALWVPSTTTSPETPWGGDCGACVVGVFVGDLSGGAVAGPKTFSWGRCSECRIRAAHTGPTTIASSISPIRTIPGPIPPEPREAPFAQVSAVLPLYHQQTKNLLVSYSPKKPGLFGTNEDRRLARTSVVPATQGWWRAAGLQEALRVRRWLFLKSTTARCE